MSKILFAFSGLSFKRGYNADGQYKFILILGPDIHYGCSLDKQKSSPSHKKGNPRIYIFVHGVPWKRNHNRSFSSTRNGCGYSTVVFVHLPVMFFIPIIVTMVLNHVLRCINLYDVRLLFRPYTMQFRELDRGSRLLININIDVAHRNSQHCSQFLFDYEYMYDMRDMRLYGTNGNSIDNVTLYTPRIRLNH